MNLNSDFRLRVVQHATDAAWTPSPLPDRNTQRTEAIIRAGRNPWPPFPVGFTPLQTRPPAQACKMSFGVPA